jgi:ClpP class serine protease
MNNILNIIWIIVLLQLFIPYLQKRMIAARRMATMRSIERKRGSRLITMIHRQETMSILGFPIARYIDIEDSEQVLRAIRMTPPETPVDLVLHTPGGLVLASEQIACALKRHKGKVTVFVPHYAMSGGTLVALAADEIVMDADAVLGPVDPQLGGQQGCYFSAASILKALEKPNPNRDDQTLILGDLAGKAASQVYDIVYDLLLQHQSSEKAAEVATMLSDGRWTHDYPISLEQARQMGLPVSDQMLEEVYALMDLYPQAGRRRPSVEFIPTPYLPPGKTPGRGEPQL